MYSKHSGRRRVAQRRAGGEPSTNARSTQRATGRSWRRIDSTDDDSDTNIKPDPDPYSDHDHDEGPSLERLAEGKWRTRKHPRFVWKPTSPLLPRKRTLSETLSESISPALKKAKIKTDLQSLQHMARSIPRCIGPFTNIRLTFLTGSELDAEIKRDPRRLDTSQTGHQAQDDSRLIPQNSRSCSGTIKASRMGFYRTPPDTRRAGQPARPLRRQGTDGRLRICPRQRSEVHPTCRWLF
ncbi:hypothetical protein BC826DRAFT_650597 [Russula brevipes]|nr:hypothetical protein BC826DRAFT_650597 [Russula brevipes]